MAARLRLAAILVLADFRECNGRVRILDKAEALVPNFFCKPRIRRNHVKEQLWQIHPVRFDLSEQLTERANVIFCIESETSKITPSDRPTSVSPGVYTKLRSSIIVRRSVPCRDSQGTHIQYNVDVPSNVSVGSSAQNRSFELTANIQFRWWRVTQALPQVERA